jgi:hypothetical protein
VLYNCYFLILIYLSVVCTCGSVAAQSQAPAEQSIENQFVFQNGDDPALKIKLPLLPKEAFRTWELKEKNIMLKCLRDLCVRAPEILQAATNGRKLRLIRVHYFKNALVRKVARGSKSDPLRLTVAAWFTDRIYFTDLFFLASEQDKAKLCLHELVHAADAGSLVAYSPEWIQFPKDTSFQFSDESHFLSDSLADYYVSYAFDSTYSNRARFKTSVLPLFMSHQAENQAFNRQVIQGMLFCSHKDDVMAFRAFLEANRIFPSSPLVHLYMSLFHLGQHNPDAALIETSTASQICSRINMPIQETLYRQLLVDHAALLISQKHAYSEASALLQRVIKADPHNESAVKLLKVCEARQL